MRIGDGELAAAPRPTAPEDIVEAEIEDPDPLKGTHRHRP